MNTKARVALPPLSVNISPQKPQSPADNVDEAIAKWSHQAPDAAASARASITRPAYPWQEHDAQETAQFLLRHLPKRTLKKLHYLKMMEAGSDTIWRIINEGIEAEVDRRLLECGIPQDAL